MLKLIIGDKSLSSWSMRPWLTLKAAKIPFEEILIPLDRPETKAALQQWSPSEKVPCLIDGDLRIWDSLAICDYIAELAPQYELWPREKSLRATAKSYVAEMHSGFQSLRTQLPMDLLLQMKIRYLNPGTIADIERILSLWKSALAKSGGPFLFGDFGIADAFFAPPVFRFISYGIQIRSEVALAYIQRMREYPAVQEWVTASQHETPRFVQFN